MGAHGVLFLLAPAVQETAVLELWEAFCLPSGLGAGKDGPDAAQLLWIYMQMRTHQLSSPVECLYGGGVGGWVTALWHQGLAITNYKVKESSTSALVI